MFPRNYQLSKTKTNDHGGNNYRHYYFLLGGVDYLCLIGTHFYFYIIFTLDLLMSLNDVIVLFTLKNFQTEMDFKCSIIIFIGIFQIIFAFGVSFENTFQHFFILLTNIDPFLSLEIV